MIILKLTVVMLIAFVGTVLSNTVKNENKYIFGYVVGIIVMFAVDLIDKCVMFRF